VATDPEHSYLFCRAHEAGKGCWHLTLAVTRPLNVLYFDGSSAAKMQGCMDSQDLIAWGHVERKRIFDEWNRIHDLCAWGKKYNLDGYMR
jgi:prepilin-type processing-associated H-X9-DG protein